MTSADDHYWVHLIYLTGQIVHSRLYYKIQMPLMLFKYRGKRFEL